MKFHDGWAETIYIFAQILRQNNNDVTLFSFFISFYQVQ